MINFIRKYPVLVIVAGFQLFRFFLLPFMGLMPQDAYYCFYGENLSLSYFDHPGMIGYILRIYISIFGKSVWVLKFADFSITSLTLLVFYQLSKRFLSSQRSRYSIVLLVSTLCISILSFNSTPDVPLLLCWSVSILCLYEAIFKQKKNYWIWSGIAMGLAFNSKYTAVLLPFGLFFFLLLSKKYRKELMAPYFWISVSVAIILTFPVWWWNYQHDFASFLFQSSGRTSKISQFRWHPQFILGAIGHQLLLLLPVLCIHFFIISFRYTKKVLFTFTLPSDRTLFLLVFFIPTFVGFMSITPFYWVKMNWLMPSYITGTILVATYIKRKHVKIHIITSFVIHLLLSVQLIWYLVPIKSDDTWVGWKSLAKEIKERQQNYPNTFIFSDDGYKTTACLNFYMHQKIYAQNVIDKPALHYDYTNDNMQLLIGKNALFIDSDKRFKNAKKNGTIPNKLIPYFQKIEELPPIIVNKNKNSARKFWVYRCINYQGKKTTSPIIRK